MTYFIQFIRPSRHQPELWDSNGREENQTEEVTTVITKAYSE
jgi:hypothetical protein